MASAALLAGAAAMRTLALATTGGSAAPTVGELAAIMLGYDLLGGGTWADVQSFVQSLLDIVCML